MKKVLLVLLALIMVLSMMTTAVAIPGNGNIPPGQAKQMIKAGMFDDIASVEDWAGDAIYFIAEKGIIKGDGYGNFLPNKPVTHGEVVTMLIRMLDLEPEVDMDADLPEWIDEEDAASWMYGYLAMADEFFGEYSGFRAMMNPNTPVKRMEIAQYIKWIIDNEEDFSAEISDDLDSMFVDADEVDPDYVEAVKLMKHTGLMIGYNNKMQPQKPVTRAQFTLIMQRLFVDFDFDFDWMDNDKTEKYTTGILTDIDESDSTTLEAIELDDEIDFDSFDEDLEIEIDNNCCKDADDEIDLEDFIDDKEKYEGLEVAVFEEDDVVVKIKIFYDELEGTIDVDETQDEEYAYLIEDEDSDKYDFDENIEICINGESLSEEDFDDFTFYDVDDLEYKVEARLLGNGDLIELCITAEYEFVLLDYEIDENGSGDEDDELEKIIVYIDDKNIDKEKDKKIDFELTIDCEISPDFDDIDDLKDVLDDLIDDEESVKFKVDGEGEIIKLEL
ncbi:S-layer homology domain-containing protein [Dethiosulfatibacter aminovorans DSM 17477]|uniref:S-layer homology domain-containing protein n=1 Tax=Dethiosulfatibacter aminovorans DSM 17477 TaxID=1121476 RepID=A0A1M6J7N7_9FIRM|nr:S-layer homology domain-containing protein [Dethiosulfatibacter aminovorans]SHJ42723.1 S-layer homology domain-containing protein [Dethiosulfatibacter aminovorans DSM 17477]